ncbi:MAG: hypothetical protein E6038_00310 [Clostridium perfringens]|nr:hypothetical protein [Clostridium perfringens]
MNNKKELLNLLKQTIELIEKKDNDLKTLYERNGVLNLTLTNMLDLFREDCSKLKNSDIYEYKSTAFFNEGRIYSILGNYKVAEKNFEESLKYNINEKDVKMIKDNIEIVKRDIARGDIL